MTNTGKWDLVDGSGKIVVPFAVDDQVTNGMERDIVQWLGEIEQDVPCMKFVHVPKGERLTTDFDEVKRKGPEKFYSIRNFLPPLFYSI